MAILLYIAGDYRVFLFDIQDKARLEYIRTYVETLLKDASWVAESLDVSEDDVCSKLKPLLRFETKDDLYRFCNFHPVITRTTDQAFLPSGSIDFMVSYCVLNHIPLNALVPELRALRQMLREDGRMYHLLGHVDHWTYHDPSVNCFNYYRYSDRRHRLLFDTKFEFQNRLVKREWLKVFPKCGLAVEEYTGVVTQESLAAIRALPHIADRFAEDPEEELAITQSYVALRRDLEPSTAASAPTDGADRAI